MNNEYTIVILIVSDAFNNSIYTTSNVRVLSAKQIHNGIINTLIDFYIDKKSECKFEVEMHLFEGVVPFYDCLSMIENGHDYYIRACSDNI